MSNFIGFPEGSNPSESRSEEVQAGRPSTDERSDSDGTPGFATPDFHTDALARPKRRTFTKETRLKIVKEWEAAPSGQKGAVLRRAGVYTGQVIQWRKGFKAMPKNKKENNSENSELKRQNAELVKELASSKKRIANLEEDVTHLTLVAGALKKIAALVKGQDSASRDVTSNEPSK